MLTFLPITLLLMSFGVAGCQKEYRKSSRTSHSQVGRIVRIDSREYYIPDDQPTRPSPNRKVHPSAPQRSSTPFPTPPPMYRQESTVGFSGDDWRARNTGVILQGGGGGTPDQAPRSATPASDAQNIDIQVRGMARLEGRPGRECCDRPEGQRFPNWLACFFACCAGRR